MFATKLAPVDVPCSAADLIAAWSETLSDAIVVCDAQWRIALLNRAARTVLSLGPDDALGMDARRVLGIGSPAGTSPAREWRRAVTLTGGRRLEARGTMIECGRSGGHGWALLLVETQRAQAVPEFIGHSAAAQELLEFVSRVAVSRVTTILIEGASGTGKELLAKRVHALGPHASGPFIALNCAALPAALLESELFGHERGAFTDAHAAREGLLEAAHGGTLFLDEIGEMPMGLQAKLLRVLEERAFRRLGGSRMIHVHLRVIAATNSDLQTAVQRREFRHDLYYRLNVVQIRVPALRDRREDIQELALHFLDQFSGAHQRRLLGIHPYALKVLESYAWPGNVRELRNVIERAVVLERSDYLTVSSLSLPGLKGRPEAVTAPAVSAPPLSLPDTEEALVRAALSQASGNQTRAAALLGIGRFSLRYKMRKLGLL